MLDAYFEAFEHYLKTGQSHRVAGFFDGATDTALLSVYRNGFLKGCTNALAASYPVVRSLVGEDHFRQLAHGYVNEFPPTVGTLVGYGDRFAEYLQSRSLEHGLDYLSDAAAIDAAWLACFFAGTVQALSSADIETLSAHGEDVSTLLVRLTPTTQLVSLEHPMVEIWTLIREQGALNSTVQLVDKKQTAMLWRLGGRIHIKALDPGEEAFLTTLSDVATLGAAAVRALHVDDTFDLANTFAVLLENQILQPEHPIA